MKVSAVGFLFQESVKNGAVKGDNYTCIIHKVRPDGNYSKNVISSPIIKKTTIETVSPATAEANINEALNLIKQEDEPVKFIGATVKDGVKETEIHSFIFDRLFAIRTKDEYGKNHFDIMGKENTRRLLADNLYA